MYADLVFYKNDFYGNTIPDNEFDMYSDKASEYIDTYTFGRAKSVSDDAAMAQIKKATCKIAEDLYYQQQFIIESKSGAISSISCGSETISFNNYNQAGTDITNTIRNELSLYLGNTGLLFAGLE